MKQKSNQEEDIDEPMPAVDMKIIIPYTAYYHRVVALCIKNSRNLYCLLQPLCYHTAPPYCLETVRVSSLLNRAKSEDNR